MNELKASIYDLKGYFVPGVVLIWTLYELVSLLGFKIVLEVQTFSFGAKAVLVIIISYIVGHCLHTFANYTVDRLEYSCCPPKYYFARQFDKDFDTKSIDAITIGIGRIFGIDIAGNTKTQLIQSSYWHCFQYVMKNEVADIENFLGFTGFYRGTTMAFLLSGISYLAALLYSFDTSILSLGIAYVFISALMLTRVRRFNCYLAKSVYSNFLYLAIK